MRALGERQGANKHMHSPGTTLPQWQGRRKRTCVGTFALQPDTDSCILCFSLDFLLLALFQNDWEADTWIKAVYMSLPLWLLSPEASKKRVRSDLEIPSEHSHVQ